MNYGSFEKQLIQQQNQYIQHLEEQLDVYKEKDKAQEQLIQALNDALELLTEELSRVKGAKKNETQKEK